MKTEKIDNNKSNKAEKIENSSQTFIREKIKDRPINKKRLARKMLFTASMAVVFASIACLTFLFLEPVLGKMITNDTEDELVLKQVTLIENEIEDEIVTELDVTPYEEENIENMSVEETPIENLSLEDTTSENIVSENIIIQKVDKEIELEDYQLIYKKMYTMNNLVSKSLVTLTSEDIKEDIFNDIFINANQTKGLIIADNGYELLVLADTSSIKSENVLLSFNNSVSCNAILKAKDEGTGLGIYSVLLEEIPLEAKSYYTIATLGSSSSIFNLGSPIIAVGDPLATGNSLSYGAITSTESKIYNLDSTYQILMTDIYGSSNANGILINIKGQVIGIICQKYNSDEMKNIICAYGISSIKSLIEDLSNGNKRYYLGLYLTDISAEAKNSLGIPEGVYVSKVEMDSPAMNVGVVPGDIIYSFDDKQISTVNEYAANLRNCNEDQIVKLGIMRLNGEEYKKMEIELTVKQME